MLCAAAKFPWTACSPSPTEGLSSWGRRDRISFLNSEPFETSSDEFSEPSLADVVGKGKQVVVAKAHRRRRRPRRRQDSDFMVDAHRPAPPPPPQARAPHPTRRHVPRVGAQVDAEGFSVVQSCRRWRRRVCCAPHGSSCSRRRWWASASIPSWQITSLPSVVSRVAASTARARRTGQGIASMAAPCLTAAPPSSGRPRIAATGAVRLGVPRLQRTQCLRALAPPAAKHCCPPSARATRHRHTLMVATTILPVDREN